MAGKVGFFRKLVLVRVRGKKKRERERKRDVQRAHLDGEGLQHLAHVYKVLE
jgi:hypothetical protein